MATSYGVSQLGILNALMSGKTKSDIYDMVKEKKEKLFDKGVKASQIEKMDKLFDKRFDNAMDDYRYKLKNRPGMKEYRKKQRSAPASDTGSEFSKGGLTGGQKKLDKNKNNRIDAEDFKILRGQGKAPMKAKKGKLVPLKKDPTRPTNPFAKKALDKGKKIIGKGGRIGAAATILGLAGAGAAKIGQTIGRKIDEAKNKNKKMGGGMMKKPGYKYGKMIEDKFNKYARSKETQLHSKDALEGFNRAEKRSVSETMGEYRKDIKKYRDSKLKRLTRFSKGGGADTGKIGEMKSKLGVLSNKVKRTNERLKRIGGKPKLQAPERGPMTPLAKKMGGGMMMKPMGYKSGTSVKVKCKLGRNKPTKMY